jgi:hypothetical protein
MDKPKIDIDQDVIMSGRIGPYLYNADEEMCEYEPTQVLLFIFQTIIAKKGMIPAPAPKSMSAPKYGFAAPLVEMERVSVVINSIGDIFKWRREMEFEQSLLNDYVFTFPRFNNHAIVIKIARMPSAYSLDTYVGHVDNKHVPGTYQGLAEELTLYIGEIRKVINVSEEQVTAWLARDLTKVLKNKAPEKVSVDTASKGFLDMLARVLGVIVGAEGARNYAMIPLSMMALYLIKRGVPVNHMFCNQGYYPAAHSGSKAGLNEVQKFYWSCIEKNSKDLSKSDIKLSKEGEHTHELMLGLIVQYLYHVFNERREDPRQTKINFNFHETEEIYSTIFSVLKRKIFDHIRVV